MIDSLLEMLFKIMLCFNEVNYSVLIFPLIPTPLAICSSEAAWVIHLQILMPWRVHYVSVFLRRYLW